MGGFACLEGPTLSMTAFVGETDGTTLIRASVQGDPSAYEDLGRQLADEILASGGRAILSDLLS